MFPQFDQVEYCNVDWQSWPLLFYPVLEFVVGDIFSNKDFIVARFVQKFEDLVDKTALIKSNFNF